MMAELIDLERRVGALEVAQNDTTQTLRWVVAKLGTMSAVQEEHTLRLEKIEADVSVLKADMSTVKADIAGLRQEMPGIVAEAMREVLKERWR
jgi:hypothetical protein